MLTSAAGPVPLTPLPLLPDEALQVCRTRRKKAPAGAAADGPAATAGGSATTATGSAPRTPPRSTRGRPRIGASGYASSSPRSAAPARTASPAGASTAARTSSRTGASSRTSSSAGAASSSRAGTASRTSSTSRSGTATAARRSGPLAFLDDPKLSVEEKLLRLLGYLNDKWNKELDARMKEFRTSSAAASTGSSGGASSFGLGGMFKKAVGFASAAIPQLGITLAALRQPAVRSVARSVAGPALAAAATAAGQPELAPIALRLGPELVDAAASVASATGGSSGSSGTGSSGSASAGSTTRDSAEGLGSGRNDQLRLMEMQRILDQQKEMFSLVSNMLRTTHDTRMAVIQNVR